jgi:threonine dehydrogenase-like Zn-dependent dehydrogenase
VRASQVVGPRRSELVELAEPVPAPDQVLVDVLACGVCTSDRRPWREQGTPEVPIRLGHEISGAIVALGSADSRWKIGDVVTGFGGDGFATRALLDERALLPVPQGLAPELSLGEPLACLVEAIGRAGIRRGDRVAVVGLGFMGLALIQLIRNLVPATIIGVDPRPEAREHALRAGAQEAFDPGEVPDRYLREGPNGQELRMDVVAEAAGVDSALRVAGRLVRPHGTLCVIGYHSSGDLQLDIDLWYKGVTVVNGFSPQRGRMMAAMAEGLDLVAGRRFTYAPLITHRFGLDQVDAAFGLMEDREPGFVKSVIIP